MRDGTTRKLNQAGSSGSFEEFSDRYAARLVIIEGPLAGTEFPVMQTPLTVGRGPGVDVAIGDPSMSRQHAVIEYRGGGFEIRDLNSTNGVMIAGEPVGAAELRHGDRFELGSQMLQFVIEQQEEQPETYEIVVDA